MGPVRIALAVAVAAAVAACSGPATSARSQAGTVPATYYLALGDSLSQGVQPDAAGTSVETEQGYPDQLYAMLHPGQPALQLVKLGCPGETTATMIHGGICRYRGGSQLAAAVAFLNAHRGQVRPGHHRHRRQRPRGLRQLGEPADPAALRRNEFPGRGRQPGHDPDPAASGRGAGCPHRRDELLPARPGRMA